MTRLEIALDTVLADPDGNRACICTSLERG